eukprot:7667374-Pyramimonas_sp.AAC.1
MGVDREHQVRPEEDEQEATEGCESETARDSRISLAVHPSLILFVVTPLARRWCYNGSGLPSDC